MNLIVDIGNSFTKIALVENYEILDLNRVESVNLDIIIRLIQINKIKQAIISCVGKPNNDLIKIIESLIPTLVLSYQTKLPITNSYKTPETLGLDRIAAVVGANYLYPTTDLLVIDSGTAITYDLVNSNAEYFGGAISPGIILRYKSLSQNTANLPMINSLEIKKVIGESTSECIESGVLNGVIGEVDYFIEKIKANHPSLKVVLTGGDANFFVNKLKNSIFVVQNLVIIGLNRILEFNTLTQKD